MYKYRESDADISMLLYRVSYNLAQEGIIKQIKKNYLQYIQ